MDGLIKIVNNLPRSNGNLFVGGDIYRGTRKKEIEKAFNSNENAW